MTLCLSRAERVAVEKAERVAVEKQDALAHSAAALAEVGFFLLLLLFLFLFLLPSFSDVSTAEDARAELEGVRDERDSLCKVLDEVQANLLASASADHAFLDML
ncbi:hypothetical protein T484DRAFT_1876230 [Baffinella frigidus]|nr:hypothetical protein T484DRAFT_1876230 [Cryptophyta sp. CCMP2293]